MTRYGKSGNSIFTGPKLKERIAPLSHADQRKVLGTNALRFYGIDV